MKKFILLSLLCTLGNLFYLNAQSFKNRFDVTQYMENKVFYNSERDMTIEYGYISTLNTSGIIVKNTRGIKFYYINCDIEALGSSATIYGMSPENGSNFGFKVYTDRLIVGDNENGKVEFKLRRK